MDKTEVAIAKMNDLKEVQIENLKNIMERDAKLDNLLEKTEQMDEQAYSMKSKVD